VSDGELREVTFLHGRNRYDFDNIKFYKHNYYVSGNQRRIAGVNERAVPMPEQSKFSLC